MKKKILVWLMALSMLLPTMSVNAVESSDTVFLTQQEESDLSEEESVPSSEPENGEEEEVEGLPTPGQTTEEPEETKQPIEDAKPTEMPEEEATSTPTESQEKVTPTPVKTPTVEATSSPTITPIATSTPTVSPTPTATATPMADVETRIYKLSHAGIIQEEKYPDDDFVRADELEGQVDLEGVKAFIAQNLLEGQKEIDIFEYQIPVFYIDQVISEVLNENPRFFYVSFDDCVVEGMTVKTVMPIYEGSAEEIVQATNEYEQAVAKALACIDNSMNAMEKASVLHDYLVTHCEYDLSYSRYTAYDALVTGSAVCQGYTLAYQELMQRAGIPSTTAPSMAMNHVWNMILIDGSWYHVDTTWDDPSNVPAKSFCDHSNFLVSDSQIAQNRHYGWTANYKATNTRFDNAEWKDSESIICKYQGAWYYMGTMGGAPGFIRRTGSLENGTSSMIQRLTKPWYVWGSTSAYWNGAFGYIATENDAVYFNGSDCVYRYEDGQVKKIYTYTGGQGYLYDIVVMNKKIYCGVSQSYEDPISYIEVTDPDHLPFSDVDEVAGNWKYESIKYVYMNGIMNGINGTDRFDPDEPLTRAMFATVLYRMAGEPAVAFENRFSDVTTGRYYSNAIIWAYKNGIVNGYEDGRYGVDDYITREQIAKMLRVYAQVRGYSTSERADINSFPDISEVSGWAVEHMRWAVGCGMINGKNVGGTYYLDAKGNATRAECAAMLTRFMGRYGE